MLNKISKEDWQFLLPTLLCTFFFIATDLFNILEKEKFAYWSGVLLTEPHRAITNHFIHGDAKHLLANTFGIIFARYNLKGLNLKGNFLFLFLIILLIPTQTLLFWLSDIFIFNNLMSLAIGFSGVLYGINAFILLASIYGKENFLGLVINLKKNQKVRQMMITFNIIGFTWSLLPGISLNGHLSGFIAGAFLFLL